MFTAQFNLPFLMKWHSRLARIPRWAWIAFFIGALLPLVLILAIAFIAGLLALAAVLAVGSGLGLFVRILRRRQNRRHQIIVRSVRIVDP
jgi:uncharacterized membrane protein